MKVKTSLIHSLYVLHHIMDMMMRQLLEKKYNMHYAQFVVLYGIATKGNPSQEELRSMVGYTPAGMSKLIDVLVKEGKIFKIVNQRNRRANVLVIEEKAKQNILTIAKEVESLLLKHTAEIPPEVCSHLPIYFDSIITSINNTYKFYSKEHCL